MGHPTENQAMPRKNTNGPADDEPTRVDRDDGWHYCDLCDARYRNMGAALQCCGDRFEVDDTREPVPESTVSGTCAVAVSAA